MGEPPQVQQNIVANISELLSLGNMDVTAGSTSGYFDVTIRREAASIDLNIVPDDEAFDDDRSTRPGGIDLNMEPNNNDCEMEWGDCLDNDRFTRPRGIDLNMEPNNNDCEMEWGDCLDAMLAGLSYELHDLYHDNYHADALAQELIALTEIDIDNDYLIEDVQLMNHRDIEVPNQDVDTDQPFQYLYSSLTEYDTEYGDHLVLESDMLLMDFEFSIDMDTDDNGNEDIDRITLESMETYMAMTIPTSKSAIEELEKVRFESVEAARHAGLCVICMEDFKAGVEATCLPCQHFYHGDCVIQWLEINHQCPLCRFLMPHD